MGGRMSVRACACVGVAVVVAGEGCVKSTQVCAEKVGKYEGVRRGRVRTTVYVRVVTMRQVCAGGWGGRGEGGASGRMDHWKKKKLRL